MELQLEKVNFKLRREPLKTVNSNLPVQREAIIREDTNQVLGVVSPDYKLIEHEYALNTVLDQLKKTGDFSLSSVRTSKLGARMFAYFNYNKEYAVDIQGKDLVHPRLTLTNSYDGSLKFGFMLGAVRLVCTNGLIANVELVVMRRLHTENLDIEAVVSAGREAMQIFESNVVPLWSRLNRIEIVVGETIEKLKEPLGERFVDAVTDKMYKPLPQKQTAWWLYNEFTRYMTHDYAPKSHDVEISRHLKLSHAFEALV